MSDIVEHLAASIHPIRLDPEDNDASVARWFVEAAIDEIQSLRQLLADTQRKLEAAEKDAERYQFLRDNFTKLWSPVTDAGRIPASDCDADVDMMIGEYRSRSIYHIQDNELPGMWEKADFEGGKPDVVRGSDYVAHDAALTESNFTSSLERQYKENQV